MSRFGSRAALVRASTGSREGRAKGSSRAFVRCLEFCDLSSQRVRSVRGHDRVQRVGRERGGNDRRRFGQYSMAISSNIGNSKQKLDMHFSTCIVIEMLVRVC